MGNRPPYNYDENADDSYPPRDSYPPQEPVNLDDPRFGGGAPTPPRDAYPPQGGQQYPPPNDPRYPPQGSQQYPPTGGQVDLNDPRFGGNNPATPTSNRGANVPPQQPSYPPQPQAGQYPPAGTGPLRLDDPPPLGSRRLGAVPNPNVAGSAYPPSTDYDRRVELGDVDPPVMRSQGKATKTKLDNTAERVGVNLNLLTERQVELLAWGFTVILFGVSLLILAVSGSSTFMTRVFPAVSGLLLLASATYQRLVRGWHVGILTWLSAFVLVAYTITRYVDISGGSANFNIIEGTIYFIGTLIVLVGVTMLLRAFRRH